VREVIQKKSNVFAKKKNSSGRVLLIYFLDVVLVFKSSVVIFWTNRSKLF
jgi:hypothetical protein